MYRNLAIDITKLQDEALPLIDNILSWLIETEYNICKDIGNTNVERKIQRIIIQCRNVFNNLKDYEDTMKKDIESIKDIEKKYMGLDVDYIAPYLPTSVSNTNHSFSQYSDKTAIEINKTECFTKLANKLTPEEYEIFCKYAEGKTLSELVDENGNLKPLPEDEELKKNFFVANYKEAITPIGWNTMSSFEERLKPENNLFNMINKDTNSNYNRINDIITKTSFMKLNDEIRDLVIEEIVSDESGYDCVVLKDLQGNYTISASFTNSNSARDVSTISYCLLDYFYDESIAKFLPYIGLSNFGDAFNDVDKLINSEELYKNQLECCENIIIKYADLAKQHNTSVEIKGYSLGGGIISAAYADLNASSKEDTIDLSYIKSVDVFNPYLLYINPINEDNKAIDAIKNDKRFTIYSVEGDIVSVFNDFNDDLKDRYIFIPFVNKDFDFSNDDKNQDIIKKTTDFFTYIYECIVGTEGFHGFSAMDYNNFDENGNLIKTGNYLTSNKIWAEYLGVEYNEFNTIPNLLEMFNVDNMPIISALIEEIKIKYGYDCSSLMDYLTNNVANFNKNEFLKVVCDTAEGIFTNEFTIKIFSESLLEEIKTEKEKRKPNNNKILILSLLNTIYEEDYNNFKEFKKNNLETHALKYTGSEIYKELINVICSSLSQELTSKDLVYMVLNSDEFDTKLLKEKYNIDVEKIKKDSGIVEDFLGFNTLKLENYFNKTENKKYVDALNDYKFDMMLETAYIMMEDPDGFLASSDNIANLLSFPSVKNNITESDIINKILDEVGRLYEENDDAREILKPLLINLIEMIPSWSNLPTTVYGIFKGDKDLINFKKRLLAILEDPIATRALINGLKTTVLEEPNSMQFSHNIGIKLIFNPLSVLPSPLLPDYAFDPTGAIAENALSNGNSVTELAYIIKTLLGEDYVENFLYNLGISFLKDV